MVNLKCPECGSYETIHPLLDDSTRHLISKKDDPGAEVFKGDLPLFSCGDCDAWFQLYPPEDSDAKMMTYKDLWWIAQGLNREIAKSGSPPAEFIDYLFLAESAHNASDSVEAVNGMRLAMMCLRNDPGTEALMDEMMDDGDITTKMALGRWLLRTLSEFEAVPSGIWEVYNEAMVLVERGEDEAAEAIMDRLIRTGDDHLVDRWKDLLKHTKREYKEHKKVLDKPSRKRVKEMMRKGDLLYGRGITITKRRALRVIYEVHRMLGTV